MTSPLLVRQGLPRQSSFWAIGLLGQGPYTFYEMMLPAWIGLNLADAALTLIGFLLGGMESNLFLGGVASTWGLERMLLIKVFLAVAIGGAIWQRRAYRVMKALNFGMMGVVLYNAVIITYALS